MRFDHKTAMGLIRGQWLSEESANAFVQKARDDSQVAREHSAIVEALNSLLHEKNEEIFLLKKELRETEQDRDNWKSRY